MRLVEHTYTLAMIVLIHAQVCERTDTSDTKLAFKRAPSRLRRRKQLANSVADLRAALAAAVLL
jgi:hypothetical protein